MICFQTNKKKSVSPLPPIAPFLSSLKKFPNLSGKLKSKGNSKLIWVCSS